MTISVKWMDSGLHCIYENCASYDEASRAFTEISKSIQDRDAQYIIHDLTRCADVDMGVAALICFSATVNSKPHIYSKTKIAVITSDESFSRLVNDLQQLVSQEIACFKEFDDCLKWIH